MAVATHRLLSPLPPRLQAVIDAVFDAFNRHNTWPNHRYLERCLAETAMTPLLSSFPSLGPVHYSAVWSSGLGGASDADREVGLTIAGLAHVDGGEKLSDPFFRMLRGVAARLNDLPMDPRDTPTLQLGFRDLAECVRQGSSDPPLADVDAVIQLIPHEPPTWNGSPSGYREDWQWHEVPWHITRFADVVSTDGYLDRLEEWVTPVLIAPSVTSRPTPSASSASEDWTALLHPGLAAHLEDDLERGRWPTAVREAAVFFEHELRARGRLSRDLVGVDLATAAFKPGRGPLAMPTTGPAAEQEGWHSLARGFMGAVRNRFAHSLHPITERTAAGAIGTASLLLLALDEHHPKPGTNEPG